MPYPSYGKFTKWRKANQLTVGAEQWIKDEIESTNSKDIDYILSTNSDDCVWENVGTGINCRGKKELRKYLEGLYTAFPDFNIEPQSSFSSGNMVCTETIMSGTFMGKMSDMPMKPTGKYWSVKGVRVTELKDGKAYKSRIYFDMASMLQQMGVMPQPPQ